jgi:hypothetical protein
MFLLYAAKSGSFLQNVAKDAELALLLTARLNAIFMEKRH